jgi:Flp pilus assembly pilin Flp
MLRQFIHFCKHETGQDLVEYTLILSFVALASAALAIGGGSSVSGIWTTANSRLTTANSSGS